MTMQRTATSLPVTAPANPHLRVVLALARNETLRMVRHPLLYLGIALSALLGVGVARSHSIDGDWAGSEYASGPVLFVPTLMAIAVIVAGAFHRERDPIGTETPTDASTRAAGILLGTMSLVAVMAVLTTSLAVYLSQTGGVDLGEEPGRTLRAHFSLFELLQHVALALLAVATGAAAGRRLAHRSTAALALFAGWFPPMFVYWLFQAPAVVPFSIIQVQPVNLRVAPPDTDPLTLPAGWLLSAPGQYQDYWGRQFVSNALAGWHDLYLLGLVCLFLSMVFTGRWRRRLLVAGTLVSVVSITAQYWIIP